MDDLALDHLTARYIEDTDLLLRWLNIFGAVRLKMGFMAEPMYMSRSWMTSRSLRTHSCLFSRDPAYSITQVSEGNSHNSQVC